MKRAWIRPLVTLYSLDRSLSNLVWLIMSATSTCMPILVEFGWVGNSPQIRDLSVTFCSVPFFRALAWSKNPWTDLHDRWLKTREIRQGCAIGVATKNSPPPPPISPKFRKFSENFALRKQFFAQNTYKSWRELHQNSYSNRKQPMTISNIALKMRPEVDFWPFLRMRSRKLAKNTWNHGPISKISRHVGNGARRSQIFWNRILHRK